MSVDNYRNRVLFVRHFAMGDVLFTTPFLRQLRRVQPDLRVDLYSLTGEPYQHNPALSAWLSPSNVSPKRVLKAPYQRIYWFSYEHDPTIHILDGYEQSTGISLEDRTLEWRVSEEEEMNARTRLEGLPRPIIGFSPVCGHALRSLSLPKTQSLIDRIQNRFKGAILVTSDRYLDLHGCVNLTAGLPSVRGVAALIAQCDAWITVDSGPLHLAQALAVPAVALFGCTLPELRVTRPSCLHVIRNEALTCLGCYHDWPMVIPQVCRRGDLACMGDLPEEEIIQALESALGGCTDKVLLARIDRYEGWHRESTKINDSKRESIIHDYRAQIMSYQKKFQPMRRLGRTLRRWKKAI